MNIIKNNWQYIFTVAILILIITQFLHVRDYVSGRLEYQWLFAELTNKDIKLFTILIAIGAGTGYLVNAVIQAFRNKTKEATSLALDERNRFTKFAIVGFMGVIWKTILLWIGVNNYGISEWIIIIPIFFIIFMHNYTLNNYWSFKNLDRASNSIIKYLGINLASGAIFFSVYYVFLFLDVHFLLASYLGVGAAAFINFAGSRLGVWKATA